MLEIYEALYEIYYWAGHNNTVFHARDTGQFATIADAERYVALYGDESRKYFLVKVRPT